MRRLATATAIALVLAGPARATYPVLDVSNLMQARLQVQEMARQYQTLMRQLEQLQRTYEAVAHPPQETLARLGRELDAARFRNALPADPDLLSALLNGTGVGLGSLQERFRTQNQVYTPSSTDFEADALRRSANSIAGVQALASAVYGSMAQHIQALQGLENELASTETEKDTADLQARISYEQTQIGAHQAQVQTLLLWQAAQERNERQRREEERRRQIDRLIEEAIAHGG